MTVLDLIEDLRVGLEAASKKFKFPAQYAETLQNVKVYSHSLPMDDVLDTKLYPLILLELQQVSHTAQGAVATILITLGNYKQENGGGVIDNLLLSQETQNYLLTHKLIGAAALLPDFDFFVVESSSDEFFFSQLLCQYKIFKMQADYLEC